MPSGSTLSDPLGPFTPLAVLEDRFGPCAGITLGFGDCELGPDGRWQWGGLFLPQQSLRGFLRQHRAASRRESLDPARSLLIVLGKLGNSRLGSGTPAAFLGVALTEPRIVSAVDVLHPHHLARRDAENSRGAFPWKEGLPFRRVWLRRPAIALSRFTGVEHRFSRADGRWIRPLDSIAPDLPHVLAGIRLREVAMERPPPGDLPVPVEALPGATAS